MALWMYNSSERNTTTPYSYRADSSYQYDRYDQYVETRATPLGKSEVSANYQCNRSYTSDSSLYERNHYSSGVGNGNDYQKVPSYTDRWRGNERTGTVHHEANYRYDRYDDTTRYSHNRDDHSRECYNPGYDYKSGSNYGGGHMGSYGRYYQSHNITADHKEQHSYSSIGYQNAGDFRSNSDCGGYNDSGYYGQDSHRKSEDYREQRIYNSSQCEHGTISNGSYADSHNRADYRGQHSQDSQQSEYNSQSSSGRGLYADSYNAMPFGGSRDTGKSGDNICVHEPCVCNQDLYYDSDSDSTDGYYGNTRADDYRGQNTYSQCNDSDHSKYSDEDCCFRLGRIRISDGYTSD